MLAAAALAFTACDTADVEGPEQGRGRFGQQMILHATLADAPATKTAVQANGTSVYWSPGDQLNVFHGAAYGGKFVSVNTEPAASADFGGSLDAIPGASSQSGDVYWAVYPYDAANTCDGSSVTLTVPSSQIAVEGTFANNLFPAIATSSSLNMNFRNLCGGARFTVATEGISSVVFKGRGGESLSGKVKVGVDASGIPSVQEVLDGVDQVVVFAPDGGTFRPGANYYAVMLPQTLSGGLDIIYRTATQMATYSLERSIPVQRSAFGIVDSYDSGLHFESMPIDRTMFPDTKFANYIFSRFDRDGNGVLSDAEMNAVTDIRVCTDTITSVKGIEYFPNLEYLNCGGSRTYNNQTYQYESHGLLTSIDISANTALLNLACFQNPGISSIDISTNTVLQRLEVACCGLTTIDVSNNPDLRYLECSRNSIGALNVTANHALRELYCYTNQINSLDLSSNTELTVLNCGSNQIRTLNLTSNVNLEELSCSSNQIESLDVSANTKLRYLACNNNQITSLDVSMLSNLESLYVYYNTLGTLDVTHNPKLTDLDCERTGITGLDLSGNPQLRYLYCANNAIENIDLSNNPYLHSLYAFNMSLTTLDLSRQPYMQYLECQNNPLEELYVVVGQPFDEFEVPQGVAVLSKAQTWSVIGEFNGWAADLDMVEQEPGVWLSPGFDCSTGQFKLRQDHDWAVNLGGTLQALGLSFNGIRDGENIQAPEGSMIAVQLDIKNPLAPVITVMQSLETFTMTAGSDYIYNLDGTVVPGVKCHDLTLKNPSGQEVAWFYLILAEGTDDYSGTYSGSGLNDHCFIAGYNMDGTITGTRYIGNDGSIVLVNTGERLTVIKVEEDTYIFSGSSGYTFAARLVDGNSQPNDEIWYTSTDGEIVTPTNTTCFGANLVSNTYENGKGILKFDGNVTMVADKSFTRSDLSPFNCCSTLSTVKLPSTVKCLGNFAFYYCGNLQEVIISDRLDYCGDAITGGSVTTFYLPEVAEIDGNAIRECPTLVRFQGPYASGDGRLLIKDGAVFSFAPSGLTSYEIPYGVTEIRHMSFAYCDNLVSVGLPESLEVISSQAFQACQSLESITLPESLSAIYAYAFNYCSNLSSIYSKRTTPPAGDYGMFQNTNDCPIYVPAGSVDAYKSAPYWSDYVDRIFAKPDVWSVIGEFNGWSEDLDMTETSPGVFVSPAFNFTKSSEYSGFKVRKDHSWEVSLGGTFVAWGQPFAAVANTPDNIIPTESARVVVTLDMTNPSSPLVTVNKATPPDNEIWYTSTDGNVVTPYRTDAGYYGGSAIVSNEYSNGKGVIRFDNNVTKIGANAFRKCSTLASIYFPGTLTRIEESAFSECSSMSMPDLPASLTSIGSGAFWGCDGIVDVYIPDSVNEFGYGIFEACQNLRSFSGKWASADGRCLDIGGILNSFAYADLADAEYSLPADVTIIGDSAFRNCWYTGRIVLGPLVSQIGSSAFAYSRISSIVMNDNVESVGSYAFRGTHISELEFPATLSYIGYDALSSSYDKVTINAVTPPEAGGQIMEEQYDFPIYVPMASLDSYKKAQYWSDFADRIVGFVSSSILAELTYDTNVFISQVGDCSGSALGYMDTISFFKIALELGADRSRLDPRSAKNYFKYRVGAAMDSVLFSQLNINALRSDSRVYCFAPDGTEIGAFQNIFSQLMNPTVGALFTTSASGDCIINAITDKNIINDQDYNAYMGFCRYDVATSTVVQLGR